MIELEELPPGSVLCRAHTGHAPAGGYPAAFVICPTAESEVKILGMVGRMHRQHWREFLQTMVDLGVKTFLSKRVDGHGVPLGTTGDDGLIRNDVAELVARFQRPDATTDMAPL